MCQVHSIRKFAINFIGPKPAHKIQSAGGFNRPDSRSVPGFANLAQSFGRKGAITKANRGLFQNRLTTFTPEDRKISDESVIILCLGASREHGTGQHAASHSHRHR